jgi:hypothetical protein
VTVRGTVGLAVVFALLVAYLRLTAPGPGSAADAQALLTPPLEGATRITLVEGGRTTEITRRDGGWSAPGVPDFLAALASLRVVAVIEDASPESYGFAPDASQLRIDSGAGPLVELELGANNPAETGVYVRRVGQRPVLLVGALLRWELEKLRGGVEKRSMP